jgi:hypothetical protein
MTSSKKSEKIIFNFTTMEWEGITVEQVKFWERCYPCLDVVDMIINKMPAWLDANPEKAHKTRWKRFINNWLASQEERRYKKFT